MMVGTMTTWKDMEQGKGSERPVSLAMARLLCMASKELDPGKGTERLRYCTKYGRNPGLAKNSTQVRVLKGCSSERNSCRVELGRSSTHNKEMKKERNKFGEEKNENLENNTPNKRKR